MDIKSEENVEESINAELIVDDTIIDTEKLDEVLLSNEESLSSDKEVEENHEEDDFVVELELQQEDEASSNEESSLEELNAPEAKDTSEENVTLENSTDSSKNNDFEMELDYFDPEKQEDKLWKARTGLDEDSLCGAIETIIFMSDRPVSIKKLKSVIDPDMPLRVIHTALKKLIESYEASFHGVRLAEIAEGYQFRTKATYSKYVQDLFKVTSLQLTPTALEVLAIIAYKQPVSKTEVEKIRGVDSSHIVRALMDKRLVKTSGRSNEAGRPTLYSTTPEFLEVFNLASIEELPTESELDELAQKNKVGKITDIKTLVTSGDKERFKFDEIDELEELAHTIKAISADTNFTKSLKVEDKKRVDEQGAVKKSAFDLLEEHVQVQQVKFANEASSNSEAFTNIIDPRVINDLTSGPFNIPEIIEEDEEFEMIDLDTGLPIPQDDLDEVESDSDTEVITNEADEVVLFEEEENSSETTMDESREKRLESNENESKDFSIDRFKGSPDSAIDDLFGDDDDNLFGDRDHLESALNDAFTKLQEQGPTEELSDDHVNEVDQDMEDNVEQKENDLNIALSEAKDLGKDLDLDLSFLEDRGE